jgi:hypothetical protein
LADFYSIQPPLLPEASRDDGRNTTSSLPGQEALVEEEGGVPSARFHEAPIASTERASPSSGVLEAPDSLREGGRALSPAREAANPVREGGSPGHPPASPQTRDTDAVPASSLSGNPAAPNTGNVGGPTLADAQMDQADGRVSGLERQGKLCVNGDARDSTNGDIVSEPPEKRRRVSGVEPLVERCLNVVGNGQGLPGSGEINRGKAEVTGDGAGVLEEMEEGRVRVAGNGPDSPGLGEINRGKAAVPSGTAALLLGSEHLGMRTAGGLDDNDVDPMEEAGGEAGAEAPEEAEKAPTPEAARDDREGGETSRREWTIEHVRVLFFPLWRALVFQLCCL